MYCNRTASPRQTSTTLETGAVQAASGRRLPSEMMGTSPPPTRLTLSTPRWCIARGRVALLSGPRPCCSQQRRCRCGAVGGGLPPIMAGCGEASDSSAPHRPPGGVSGTGSGSMWPSAADGSEPAPMLPVMKGGSVSLAMGAPAADSAADLTVDLVIDPAADPTGGAGALGAGASSVSTSMAEAPPS